MRIEITPNDKALKEDLIDRDFDGVRVIERMFFRDTAEAIDPVIKVLSFVVELSVDFSKSLFLLWLVQQLVDKKTKKVIVDGADLTNDPKQITIVINNYIQNTVESHDASRTDD